MEQTSPPSIRCPSPDPLRIVTFCRWSPDGQKIAFVQLSTPAFGPGWEDIYEINANGSGLTQIISDPPGGFVLALDWSPDSQALVFEFDYAPDGLDIQTRDIWALAGATLVQRTTDEAPRLRGDLKCRPHFGNAAPRTMLGNYYDDVFLSCTCLLR